MEFHRPTGELGERGGDLGKIRAESSVEACRPQEAPYLPLVGGYWKVQDGGHVRSRRTNTAKPHFVSKVEDFGPAKV